MGGVRVLVAAQLLFFLVSSLTSTSIAFVLPPTPPPIKPPALLPIRQPAPPPTPAPKKYHVAIYGFVICSYCELPGIHKNTFPIRGAVVKLQCKVPSVGKPYQITATTSRAGYFYIEASPRVSSIDITNCNLSLVSSPKANCNVPGNGVGGTGLKYKGTSVNKKKSVYNLYNAGSLYFTPKPHLCP